MALKKYEIVLVYDSDLEDAAVGEQLDKVAAVIASHGGEIERREIWGRKELAYKINKKGFGVYAYLIFSGDNALVADLDRQLKINESVLRHLIVVKDKYAPDYVAPKPDAPRSRGVDDFGLGDGGPLN